MEATAARPRARPEALIPEGTAPPQGIPPEIFQAALATFLERRRLDMRELAAELGMGRATLYRRVGNRDRLLGEVLWFLARRALVDAVEHAGERSGAERIVAVVDGFLSFARAQPALRALLDAEPEAALRVLTSKQGPVQLGLVEALERLLAEEEARGALRLPSDRRTLAYVVVRIGESFLYADAIAGEEPDLAAAVELVARLLREG